MSDVTPMWEYGILCSAEDERRLVKNINAFLESREFRKMYKEKKSSMLNARKPFVYTHYYWQMLKGSIRWYFELYPNTDSEGKTKVDQTRVGWLLFLNKPDWENDTPEKDGQIEAFFAELREAAGFETVLIKQYGQGDERL